MFNYSVQLAVSYVKLDDSVFLGHKYDWSCPVRLCEFDAVLQKHFIDLDLHKLSSLGACPVWC